MVDTIIGGGAIVAFIVVIVGVWLESKRRDLGAIICCAVALLLFAGSFAIGMNRHSVEASVIVETKTLPQFRIDEQEEMVYWFDGDAISGMKLSDVKFVVVDAQRSMEVEMSSESLPYLCVIETETYEVGYWLFAKIVSRPTIIRRNYVFIPRELMVEHLDDSLDWTALFYLDVTSIVLPTVPPTISPD